LLEDYADEWVVRVMLASRWLHEPDAEHNRTVIAADMTCGAPEVEVAVAKEMFPQAIMATLPPMGATRETLGFLLNDLGGLVTDLDALFVAHRFLGGAEPTVADLAFYGQLNQIRRDPTGRAMVGAPARPPGRFSRSSPGSEGFSRRTRRSSSRPLASVAPRRSRRASSVPGGAPSARRRSRLRTRPASPAA